MTSTDQKGPTMNLRELSPAKMVVGDRLPNPRLGARQGGYVTVDAIRYQNRHRNSVRVTWRDADGNTATDVLGATYRLLVDARGPRTPATEWWIGPDAVAAAALRVENEKRAKRRRYYR